MGQAKGRWVLNNSFSFFFACKSNSDYLFYKLDGRLIMYSLKYMIGPHFIKTLLIETFLKWIWLAWDTSWRSALVTDNLKIHTFSEATVSLNISCLYIVRITRVSAHMAYRQGTLWPLGPVSRFQTSNTIDKTLFLSCMNLCYCCVCSSNI